MKINCFLTVEGARSSLVLGLFLPLLANPVAAQTTEQERALKKLIDEELVLTAKLEALAKKRKLLEEEIDQQASNPTSPATTPSSGDDLFGKGFAEFRERSNFKIRKSVFDKSGEKEPATLQFSGQGGGEDSLLADLGVSLSWDLPDSDSTWVSVLGDFHRNDLGKSETDSYVGALELNHNLGGSTANAQRVSMQFGYKADNVLSGEGLTGGVIWFPSHASMGIGEFWHDYEYFSGRIAPFIGFEIESGDGELKGFSRGTRNSFKVGVTATGILLPDVFGNRLEATVTGGYWNHLDTSGGYNSYSNQQVYFSGSLT